MLSLLMTLIWWNKNVRIFNPQNYIIETAVGEESYSYTYNCHLRVYIHMYMHTYIHTSSEQIQPVSQYKSQ